MPNLEVRRPLYAGSQMVRALWFDRALLGELEAQRRLLALWEPGARAWALHGGYLLEWQRARRLQCERAPGLPLVEQDGVLASAPLQPAERAGIEPGSAVLVLGAGVHAEPLAPGLRIDPSEWLDLAALPLCVALSMPPVQGSGFVDGVPAPAADLRAVLGDAVPPPSPKRAEFLRQAQRAQASGGLGGGVGLGTVGRMLGAGALIAAVAGGGTIGLLALLPRLLLPGIGGVAGSGPARPAGPPGSASSALRDWFAERFARLAMLTRVSRLMGLRQAAYLRKMLRQFEQGDLDEALRHAIPLDNPAGSNRPSFGVPGRRATLDVRGPGGAGAGIGLDDRLMQYLRTTYQRSFEMLDRAGRIDEAVYVLAELMNRRQEAVDYLERKGRINQAAQLAETLELPPTVIVRLHFLAGDTQRAVLLARLSDSFAGAVAELERRGDDRAGALRLEWAQSLAARGSLIEAVTTVWPLQQERERARAWLHQAEQAGGALGVQGLVYTLALDPQARQARRDAVQELLYAEGEDAARRRLRARDCLAGLDKHNDTTHRLAAELWRRLLLDRAAGLNAITQGDLSALRLPAADPVLNADLPKNGLPPATLLRARGTPLQLRFEERGLLPIEDVLPLPDGDLLLALGEAGIALLDAHGKERMRFPIPAHHLVGARNGRHALALARRERTMRVSRIDLLHRKASDWFSAPLEFWARDYDGDSWSVVAQERLMALDTAAPGQSVLWQVRDLGGWIVGFDEQGGMQAILLEVDGGVEQWRYALPERRLRQRERFDIREEPYILLPDCAHDEPVRLKLDAGKARVQPAVLTLLSGPHGKGGTIDLSRATERPGVSLHDGLLLLNFATEGGACSQLVDFNGRVLAEIELPEAKKARSSVRGGVLLAWDQCGRIVAVDTRDGAVRMVTAR